jgi:hypothetical protein
LGVERDSDVRGDRDWGGNRSREELERGMRILQGNEKLGRNREWGVEAKTRAAGSGQWGSQRAAGSKKYAVGGRQWKEKWPRPTPTPLIPLRKIRVEAGEEREEA